MVLKTHDMTTKLINLITSVDKMNEYYFVLNENFEFTFVNNDFITLSDDSSHIIGSNIFDINPNLKNTAFEENYIKAFKEQKPVFFHALHPSWHKLLDVRVFPTANNLTVFLRDMSYDYSKQPLSNILKNCVDSISDLIIIIAEATNNENIKNSPAILYVNQGFIDKTGFTKKEIIGKPSSFLFGPNTKKETLEDIVLHLKLKQHFKTEVLTYKKNGDSFWVDLDITPVFDPNGVHTHWISIQKDITEKKKIQDIHFKLAFFDTLTHIPNRTYFEKEIENTIFEVKSTDEYSSLFFIDLDNFKTLNDTMGHSKGDLLLKEIARRFEQEIGSNDFVARLGGDEFVIILKNLGINKQTAIHKTTDFAKRLLIVIENPFIVENYKYVPSASIGITFIGEREKTQEELIQEADLAMYNSKENGKNSYSLYSPQFKEKAKQRQSTEKDLKEALLKDNELILYFQPQFERNRIFGVEALARWIHPIKGFIYPNSFIPVAEETELICDLDYYILHKSCNHLEKWMTVSSMSGLTLSVNLSPKTFLKNDFLHNVLDITSQYKFPPNKLKFEITENFLLEDSEHAISKMNYLIDKGFSFSLDDFGIGYSSLSYLRKFPIQEIKIDRSFIIDSFHNSKDKIIIESIINLANKLNLNIISEGVETKEQKQFLLTSGCAKQQGFYYSKPITENSLIQLAHDINN